MAGNRGAAATIGACLLAVASWARADATMRVTVRVSSARDRAVAERLQGQASDLPVALSLVRRAAAPLPAQADEAAALTAGAGTDATIWFARVSGPVERYLVFVSPAGEEPSLLARLTLAGGRLTSSGLETAALVARTALQALLLGESVRALEPAEDERPVPQSSGAPASPGLEPRPRGPGTEYGDAMGFEGGTGAAGPPGASGAAGRPGGIGPERPRATPEAGPAPEGAAPIGPTGGAGSTAPQATPASHDPGGPSPGLAAAGDRRAATPHIQVFMGLQQALADGTGTLGRAGARLRVAMQLGAIEFGFSGALSLPATVDHPLADLRIARHDAQGTAAVHLDGHGFSLQLGGRAGFALFHRETQPGSDRLAATGSQLTPAFLLGPWLGCAWMFGSFGIGLQAALDVLPDAPYFVYDGAGAANAQVHRPPVVVPQFSAGLQVRLL